MQCAVPRGVVERLTAGDRIELGADTEGQSGVRDRKTGVYPPSVIGAERKSHSDCGGGPHRLVRPGDPEGAGDGRTADQPPGTVTGVCIAGLSLGALPPRLA